MGEWVRVCVTKCEKFSMHGKIIEILSKKKQPDIVVTRKSSDCKTTLDEKIKKNAVNTDTNSMTLFSDKHSIILAMIPIVLTVIYWLFLRW
jgi:hypothetical protein